MFNYVILKVPLRYCKNANLATFCYFTIHFGIQNNCLLFPLKKHFPSKPQNDLSEAAFAAKMKLNKAHKHLNESAPAEWRPKECVCDENAPPH